MSGRRRLDLLVRSLGLGRVGSSAPFNLAGENLSLWIRGDDATGTTSTLSWPGRSSAGVSSFAAPFDHDSGFGNQVVRPGTALDSQVTVEWPSAASFPRLQSTTRTRIDFLGQGNNVGASYTLAAVVQPLSSNANGLASGKVNDANPALLADLSSYARIGAIQSASGVAKVGVYHFDGPGAVGDGCAPVTWPGGFGAWGLLWVSFAYVSGSSGTVAIRINASDMLSQSIPVMRGTTASDGNTISGATGGGTYAAGFRLAEMAVWPGVALSSSQISARESYFRARYPSLGI